MCIANYTKSSSNVWYDMRIYVAKGLALLGSRGSKRRHHLSREQLQRPCCLVRIEAGELSRHDEMGAAEIFAELPELAGNLGRRPDHCGLSEPRMAEFAW